MAELHGYEVKIKTTKKCPMCRKPLVRVYVFENNKFVYKERCCNIFCRRYEFESKWKTSK